MGPYNAPPLVGGWIKFSRVLGDQRAEGSPLCFREMGRLEAAMHFVPWNRNVQNPLSILRDLLKARQKTAHVIPHPHSSVGMKKIVVLHHCISSHIIPHHPISSHIIPHVHTCSARLPNVKSLDEIQSNANESRGHELLWFHVTKLEGIEEDLSRQWQHANSSVT